MLAEGNIQQFLMKNSRLSKILSQLHLDIDLTTRVDIQKFINTISMPSESQAYDKLDIVAAIAIKTEIQRLPAVGQRMMVRTGLSLELYLQHLKKDEKLVFLEKLPQVVKELKDSPLYLLPKINEISRRYNIFVNFRNAFDQLVGSTACKSQQRPNIFSIIWMMNLKTKQLFQQNSKQDMKEVENHIILALLHYSLPRISAGFDMDLIPTAFRKHFRWQVSLNKQHQQEYERQFQAILTLAHSIRNRNGPIDWNLVSNDQQFLARLVDDFSNQLSKRSNILCDDDIDELSFLGLNKSIAPLPKRPADSVEVIQTPISFINFQADLFNSGSNNQINDEHNEPVIQISTPPVASQKSPEQISGQQKFQQIKNEIFRPFFNEQQEDYKETLKRRKKFVIENSPTRIYIMKWIQDAIKTVETQESLKINPRDAEEISILSWYEAKSFPKIVELIEKSCENCRDKHHRANQIYKFFVFFLNKLKAQIKKEEFKSIIQNQEYLNSFLCVTTMIFNHAYRAQQLPFVDYCCHFNLSVIRGFVPLNTLGRNEMPKQLQAYLYEIEERILFEEIWKTDLGSQIFSSNASSYLQLAMKKRTFDHLSHQIMRVCQAQLTDKERYNLFKFIEDILSRKVELLRHNNLYIILICSIVYCHGKAISLGKINDILRKNQKMAAINLDFKDPSGKSIAAGEYYQSYFLREIQPLILSSSKKENFISPYKSTPKTVLRQQNQSKPLITISKYKFGIDPLAKPKLNPKILFPGQFRQEYSSGYPRIIEKLKSIQIKSLSQEEGQDPDL